ncbi:ferrous iron transport protein B [Xanthovirga aplysinae]|uniref:ferrous iron transport protein B n=1 Tax=Xanthovirga aplysinae TaxID=2529853 RepID=UPI0012BB8C62|nr:ferrous iron transport protein B [Xanthovirga aplysinae]MTI32562.1 ferrous iron transport protein B [Xanthovirga aplysinae]
MKLSELEIGESAVISRVEGNGAFRKRLTEMGFIKGKDVFVVKKAPLKDPIEYQIMDYKVSLRKTEADLIEIKTIIDEQDSIGNNFFGVHRLEERVSVLKKDKRNIKVALVGNPNAGKTTLFNLASGSKERTGNYTGVTVDTKTARFKQDGYTFHITDLPGTYSLTAHSPEELFVRQHLLEENPDVVVNIIDASNLERNLYLTTQLMDMGVKVVIALNMYDELLEGGDQLDNKGLGQALGIPIMPTVSSKGKGIKELFAKILEVYKEQVNSNRLSLHYGKEVESSLERIQSRLVKTPLPMSLKGLSTRFLSIKILEKDEAINRELKKTMGADEVVSVGRKEVQSIEQKFGEDSETVLTDQKYSFIEGVLEPTLKKNKVNKKRLSDKIDLLLTHRIWGFPIFLFLMWLMFTLTFSLGQIPMDMIDNGVAALGDFIVSHMDDGPLKGLLVDGIIGGLGGVIVFLPNIMILFFFISLMEDTGYMARAAFIMDKFMHKLGLHGKSFIPLIMGFGCNVPAVMATRTLENRNDRLLTMLINPFMSCSARLPIYILFAGAFFPAHAGTLLFVIYLIGILLAVGVAVFFKKVIFKSKEAPFVMELPPYRLPTLKASIIHMWNKASQYLKKMGGVILVASILVWALGYFPREVHFSQDYDQQIEMLQSQEVSSLGGENSIVSEKIKLEKADQIEQIEEKKEQERFEKSYIGRLGKWIEPTIRPLGFDWKMGVSLLTGVAAKEIVVSTMGVLYQAGEDADENSQSLMHKLQEHTYQEGPNKGQKVYTPLKVFAFLIFVLIYFPCVSVAAAVRKEAGSWKWVVFIQSYTTVLAWVMAFIIYQLGSLII